MRAEKPSFLLRLRVRGEQAAHDALNRLYCLTRRVSLEHPVLFVAGLPKSGTTWVENFLGSVPGYVNRPLRGDREIIRNENLPLGSLSRFPTWAGTVVKTHAYPGEENLKALDEAGLRRILIMFRDPRDTAVSRYFHFAKLGRSPQDQDDLDYRTATQEEGLTRSAKIICEHRLDWMKGWFAWHKESPERFGLVRYEDLRDDPLGQFDRLSKFFELGLSEQAVEGLLQKLEWMRDRGIKTSEASGRKSTFRAGEVGAWRNVLPPAALEIFAAYDDDIRALGYEATGEHD